MFFGKASEKQGEQLERAAKERYHNFVWQSKSKDASLNDSHLSILNLMPEGCSSILDIGCGTGNLSYVLLKQGREVIGLDIAGAALAEAGKKGVAVVKGDLDGKLPFKDSSFDCAVCCQVLQHIFEPVQLVKEMKRVSRKFVIMNVPNIAYWKYRVRLMRGEFPFTSIAYHEPIRFFTINTFKRMITDADLVLDKIIYTGSRLTKAGSVFATGFTVLARKEN